MDSRARSGKGLMQAVMIVWLFGFAAPGAALGAEPLTLQAAVRMAVDHNPAIKESLANREAAGQAKREAWLSRLPSLEVREVFVRTDSPADVFGLQLMQERFSFPEFTVSDPNAPDPFNNYTTELQASMPLFTGGRLEAGIGQASRMARAAAAIADHTREAVSLGVATAYTNVLLADRFVELAEKARETTAKHVEMARAYYDTGMIVESDLLQAQVYLSRMEEGLIVARNNSRLARAGLNRAMGVGLDREFALDSNLPACEVKTTSLDDALSAAHARRGDLKAASLKVEAADKGVQRAFGEYLPEIGLVGKISLNDDRIFGDHGRSTTLMAVARWNVWNFGQTQARLSRSKAERSAARESERAYRQGVDFEVLQAWLAVEEAGARLEAAGESTGQAERALAIIEDRWRQGIARISDLMDAETMQNEARARELNARFDLERSVRNLNFVAGLPPVPES